MRQDSKSCEWLCKIVCDLALREQTTIFLIKSN
jgi:hypothetical protein